MVEEESTSAERAVGSGAADSAATAPRIAKPPPRGANDSRWRRMRRRLSDLQVLAFGPVGLLIRAWRALVQFGVRYDRRGPLFDFIAQGRPCIVALWHQDTFPLMFELMRYTRRKRWPAMFMVSHGRVGTQGGYLLGLWDIECVSGSGRTHGIQAVDSLAEIARVEQRTVFIMADGSRGPACQARWGAVHLARDSGLPIVAARAWGNNLMTLENTWMKLVLPKPWGRAVVLSAEPLTVAADADKSDLEAARLELEGRLNRLAADARRYVAEGPQVADAYGPEQPVPGS
jgi:lysophospholipid acyltransferase (LPLAT)-like uncharacterized protein